MTTFLFLQKFSSGKPEPMLYQEVLDTLSKFGKVGRGRGDTEVTLPPGQYADVCTVVGNPKEGASCVCFERPQFGKDLRLLTWTLMNRLQCTAFDGTLHTLCTPPNGLPGLPQEMVAATPFHPRQICTMQQLWPDGTEISMEQSRQIPGLRYTNPNPAGTNIQLFDDISGNDPLVLTFRFDFIPEICNPGTLRALRNIDVRINAARQVNEVGVIYHFVNNEASLRYLESAAIEKPAYRITITTPPLNALDGITNKGVPDTFVADRGIFFSMIQQSMNFTRHALEKFQLELDGSVKSIAALARHLDKLHIEDKQFRRTLPTESQVAVTSTTDWTDMAGCYLGTVIRREVGGQCGYIVRDASRLPAIRLHGGQTCNPFLRVMDHIVNGPRDSIALYFHQLMKNGASATHRTDDHVCNIPGFCSILRGESHFTSGSFPLGAQLPSGKLDFTVHSLKYLDQYLFAVARRITTFSETDVSNLVLAAGSYVGEVIRSNSVPKNYWRWVPYDDHIRQNPKFAQQRSRHYLFLAILDSDHNTTYPMAQVSAILHESSTNPPATSAHAYGRQMVNLSRGSLSCSVLDDIKIRERIAALTPQERNSLLIPAPPWAKSNPIEKWFECLPVLLEKGRLTWGCIVQANNTLFAPGSTNAPAAIIFDPQGILTPDELSPIAQTLFGTRGRVAEFDPSKPEEEELLAVANILNAETIYPFGVKVPSHLSAEPLLLTTLFLDRRHMLGGRLTVPFFPVLVHDDFPDYAMMLPSRWWPEPLQNRVSNVQKAAASRQKT